MSESENPEDRIAAVRERIQAVLAERRANKPIQLRRTTPMRQPRYDDVFFRGLEEMEQADREHGLLPLNPLVELRLVPVEYEHLEIERLAVVKDLLETIAGDGSATAETSRWRATTALAILEGTWDGD